MSEEMDIVKDISDIVRKHLKSLCKELTKEGQFIYSIVYCKLEKGKVCFGVRYQNEIMKAGKISVITENEIEVNKAMELGSIKRNIRSKITGKLNKE